MSGIKAGDLVMVVRPAPCCGIALKIGYTYRVHKVSEPTFVQCGHCRRIVSTRLVEDGAPDRGGYRIGCVTKIDPGIVDDEVNTTEEIAA